MKCPLAPLDIVIKRENALNSYRSTMDFSDMYLQSRACDEWVSANYTDKQGNTQVIAYIVQYIVSKTRTAFVADTREGCLTKNQLLSIGLDAVNAATMFNSPMRLSDITHNKDGHGHLPPK